MTQDDMNEMAQQFILLTHNIEQDRIFKEGGGIPLPKFKSYKEMKDFWEVVKKIYPSSTMKFKECEHKNPEEIIYNIDEKYK